MEVRLRERRRWRPSGLTRTVIPQTGSFTVSASRRNVGRRRVMMIVVHDVATFMGVCCSFHASSDWKLKLFLMGWPAAYALDRETREERPRVRAWPRQAKMPAPIIHFGALATPAGESCDAVFL